MGFFDYLINAGIWPVGFIHHNNHRHLGGEGFTKHEPSLRQRAFGGIDKQDNAIDHGQTAFYFPTEIGVARGVDDVDDEVIAVFTQSLAANGGIFGQDGDAFFFF